MKSKITFEEYLMEVHAEDYTGCDDNMPDDFSENFLQKLTNEQLSDYFILYINSFCATDEIRMKYIGFIQSLSQ